MVKLEEISMIKSEERTTEYCVIIQPRNREHPPICYKGYAKDEEEASSAVFDYEWHKEVLEVKVSDEIEWNSETAKRYWKEYGEPTENVETEVKLF